MDAPTAGHPKALSLGALVTEGKTKKIFRINGSDLVSVVAKDDITAGDGAKHDVIPDKGRLATATTCNVFRLLKACGLPVAFEEQNSATSFIAPPCTMLPYEVVVRREAHGSALKRSPHFAKGQLFPKLLVEFYLKTKDKNWKGKPLVADDPLMQYEDGGAQIRLFNPAKPILGSEPFLVLQTADVFSPSRGIQVLPGDAADRAPGVPGAGAGLVARRRHAGRFQGRVRLRRQGQPAARRRDRQRLVAGAGERRLHRQAGLSRRRRARHGGGEIQAGGRDHRPFPAAAAAHHPVARLGERQDRGVLRGARRPEGPDDGRDLLHPQGAGGGRRHPEPDDPGGAGLAS